MLTGSQLTSLTRSLLLRSRYSGLQGRYLWCGWKEFQTYISFCFTMNTCRFELGAALFIGWAGSVLCILGGLIFCLSLSEGFSMRQVAWFFFWLNAYNVIPHLSPATRASGEIWFGRTVKSTELLIQSGNLNNYFNCNGEIVTVVKHPVISLNILSHNCWTYTANCTIVVSISRAAVEDWMFPLLQ